MTVDQLDATFSALADPTRRAILARLVDGEATVNELAEPFDMSLQAVSKHIKVLERAGLISRRVQAQERRCGLQPGALDQAADWIEQQRRVWTDRFDRLNSHLKAVQKGTQDDTATHDNH